MPNPVFITLDTNEFADVVRIGVEQTLDALLSQRRGSHGIDAVDNESFDLRIRGVIGEHVVGKHLGVPWLSLKDVFSQEDLPGIDVKTAGEIGKPLIVRKNVEGLMKLVLVTPGWNRPLDWIIWGWITAEEGRQVGRRTDFGNGREHVWAVSHTALHDIRELGGLVIPLRLSKDLGLFCSTLD